MDETPTRRSGTFRRRASRPQRPRPPRPVGSSPPWSRRATFICRPCTNRIRPRGPDTNRISPSTVSGQSMRPWKKAESRTAATRAFASGERRSIKTSNFTRSSPARFGDAGGKVLVLGEVRFRGKASSIEMRHPFAWICEMREGALSRMFFCSSHAAALEAVGRAK